MHEGGIALRRGFTLIELAVAIAILGVLATIAQSSFRRYTMKAERTEARSGLRSIFIAQTAYFNDSFAYGNSFVDIGVPFDGGTRIDDQTIQAKTYTFTVRGLPLGQNPLGNFQAIATGDLDPGDGVLDILMIENQLTVLP